MSSCRLIVLSAVVLLLCTAAITEGMRYSSVRTSCCYTFAQKPLKSTNVQSYSLSSPQCINQAVMFKTMKGKQVCARPTEQWVKKLMKLLDNKKSGSQGSV
ncbi:monocyte chemotactic protein 1B-like [Trichomycterus rosablanca]|uniref:monocyte chemotactic protein 1B-like n=1 Tax=Trichomycterus rosablanca TaxID=2290929 RepID=UPI002F35F1AD